MNTQNYELLKDMLNEYRLELCDIESQIKNNSLKIQETDYYVASMLQEETEDFKIFSPRSARNHYNTEISKSEDEKKNYIEENSRLLLQKERILSKIETLEKVLQKESETDLSILTVQEEDRHRIARDLHDTSLQNIAYLVHKIELSSMFIDQDPLRAKLELSVVNKHLRAVIEEIRGIIFDLRPMPFDDLGLKAAIERLITVINEEKKYEIDMSIEDVSCENNIILVTIYRVVQECLTNIIKHADATKISFYSRFHDTKYYITISDNGKGFDESILEQKESNHFGISLIKERIKLVGGNIIISSESNKGTKIEIEVPIN